MRNPFCPHYNECLTPAARLNKQFDCRGCKYEAIEKFEFDWPMEVVGCCRLLDAVFKDRGSLVVFKKF